MAMDKKDKGIGRDELKDRKRSRLPDSEMIDDSDLWNDLFNYNKVGESEANHEENSDINTTCSSTWANATNKEFLNVELTEDEDK